MIRRFLVPFAILALVVSPAFADHETEEGDSECSYAHDEPHYGLTRDDPNNPSPDWVTQGDPENPWVGSTSPTGAVYAGRFGGSDGEAFLSVGACGVGLTEVAVYQEDDGSVNVVVMGDNGNQNSAGNGYAGVNTGHGDEDTNKGGPLCISGNCVVDDSPVVCENPRDGERVDWHDTDADGCEL